MRLSRLAAVTVATGVAVIGTALPASATKDGRCDPGDGCLYYSSNLAGSSLIAYTSTVTDFATDTFISAGHGRGELVKNNAASVWNRYLYAPLYVYHNENLVGPYDRIAPASLVQFVVRSENASMAWRSE